MPDPIPSCFFGDAHRGKEAQNLVTCMYQTKLAGHCRLLTVTWCKNATGQGLSVSVDDPLDQSVCKIDLKPWCFWKKQGSKGFEVNGTKVHVCWDLCSAKFCGPEPQECYYVAVVCEEELILLLGDMKKEAFRKTKARPSIIEATLVSRKEHVFGKKYFTTRTRLDEAQSQPHEISIECQTTGPRDPEMSIKIDGKVVVNVKRLLWKFRGNQTINLSGVPVQVFWDVHDWLFNPGFGHALFIFKRICSSPAPEKSTAQDSSSNDASMKFTSCANAEDRNLGNSSAYCLLLYAWKLN
uniref:TSA: Wollemia nobilis Ref_Wollemi_Transcript_10747_2254 transcribed RNA sequence n=1 Tax=Wollemia nobilis TaxID=56998 RepID=A0A0C9RMI9_9CONI